MKKILAVSFVLLFVLCSIAFADMSAPSRIAYSGYVSNPDGATYFIQGDSWNDLKEEGTLEFQTKIIFTSSYGYDKFQFILEGESFGSNDSKIKYINREDVTVNDLTKYKLREKENVRTFSETYIYDIPVDFLETENSTSYILGETISASEDILSHVIGTIPSETDLVVQEYDTEEEYDYIGSDWSKWYYTSYNGVNGWIGLASIAWKYDENYEYYTERITSRNLLSDNGLFVPMYTPIKEYYRFGGGDYSSLIIYYSGDIVRLNSEVDTAYPSKNEQYRDNEFVVQFEGLNLYEQANASSKIVYENIPVGTTLVSEYITSDRGPVWINVTYDNVRGWFFVGDLYSYRNELVAQESFAENIEHLEKIRGEDDVNTEYFNDINFPSNYEELATSYQKKLEEQRKLDEEYHKLITKEDAKIKSLDELNNEENIQNNESIEQITTPTNAGNNPSFVPAAQDNSGIANTTLIVVLSVIILLMAIVIIILLNKKK